MFGLQSTIPLAKEFLSLNIVVILTSIFTLMIFLNYERKLTYWIKNFTDVNIKLLDEQDLYRVKKGIQNSIVAFWLGLTLYTLFFIIQ